MGVGIATGVTEMAFPSAHEGSERGVRHFLTLLLREQSGLGASPFSWRPGVKFLGVPGGARRPLAGFSLPESRVCVCVLSLLSVWLRFAEPCARWNCCACPRLAPLRGLACGLSPPSGGALEPASAPTSGGRSPPAAAAVGPRTAPLRAHNAGDLSLRRGVGDDCDSFSPPLFFVAWRLRCFSSWRREFVPGR